MTLKGNILTIGASPFRNSPHYAGLLSDYDGTIHHDDGAVSQPVRDAIQKLISNGVPFGVCTGRQYGFVKPYLATLPPDSLHVVCGGAQLVTARGDVIQQALIPAETMKAIAAFIESVDGYLLVKHTHVTYANHIALADKPPGHLAVYPLEQIPTWETPAFYVRDVDEPTWDALANRSDIQLVRQRFRSGKPGYFADGTAPEVTKATGVGWWCQQHNLPADKVIGIGDGENDLGLFAAVGLKLAMGNAVPELKAAADAVIPSITQNGVAWAIDTYWGYR